MQVDLEKLRELWTEKPYGHFLNALDDLLEPKIGRTSTQAELGYIAECQEEFCLPSECADSIHSDNWR